MSWTACPRCGMRSVHVPDPLPEEPMQKTRRVFVTLELETDASLSTLLSHGLWESAGVGACTQVQVNVARVSPVVAVGFAPDVVFHAKKRPRRAALYKARRKA